MAIYNYNELKKKDVIDVKSGKILGKINDLILDVKNGKILKIVVPGKKGGFLSCENVEISFNCIEKIGDDAILVLRDRRCEEGEKPCRELPPPCAPPCDKQEFFDDN